MYQTKRYEKEITVKDYLAQYVNIEEFLEYCKACKNYDRLWSCPSYDFEQEAYWKQYEKLYILGYQIFFEEGTTEAESLQIMAEVKARMSEDGNGVSGVCIAVGGQLQRVRRRKLHQTAGRALQISGQAAVFD